MIKRLGFHWRLFLMFILVIGIGIGAVVLFMGNNVSATVRTNEGKEVFDRVTRMKTELQQYYDANQSWAEVQATVEQIARLNGIRVLLTSDNIIVADSEKTYLGMTYDPAKPTDLMLSTDNQTSAAPQHPLGVLFVSKMLDGKTTVEMMPFPVPPHFDQRPSDPAPQRWEDLRQKQIDDFRQSLNWAVLWAVLLGVGLAAFISFFWSRSLTKPLGSLAAAARSLAKGDLSRRVNIKSKDEIGQLGTDFNSMAEDLERTDKLRRNMVADIAHELRTPLSNIRGYVEGIYDGVVTVDEETKEYIYREVMLLTRLVEDLHDLALAESGELKLSLSIQDIRQIASDSLKSLQPRMAFQNINSKLDLPDAPVLSMVDSERISQVLRNLIVNATNFTPEGGTITVSVKQKGNEVEVGVSDTGVGIPASELPMVFERFYRVDKSRTRSTGGSGLGLTIASQLIKAHKGSIRVESEVGKGARFYITLPVVHPGDDMEPESMN